MKTWARSHFGLVAALLLAACERKAPAAQRAAPRAQPGRDAAATRAAPVAETPAVDPPARRAPDVASRPFRVERAAAVGPSKVFAVSDERLWRVVDGQWTELPLDGASVRDVTALLGTIWVLARGGNENLGHVTVLRSTGADDLTVAWDVVTAPTHEPRALAVASERDFYVGGENPTLLRARYAGSLQTSATTLPAPVLGLLYMPDQMMAVTYSDGRVGMFRWG